MGSPAKAAARIVHLGKFYPPHMGGIETHLQNLCRELASDFRVSAIVSNDGPTQQDDTDRGVHVRRLATRFQVSGAPVCRGTLTGIRNSAADLIHLHLPNPVASLALLASGYRGPVVVTYHSDVVRQKLLSHLFTPILNTLLRRADAIICTSQRYLDSSMPLRQFRRKCVVIPYGIPEPRRIDSAAAKEITTIRNQFGKKIIVAVGRLVYYKGFEYLIEAMRNIDATLLIIGDGPLRQALTKQIDDASLQHRVKLLGEIQNDRISPYYAAADIFALPSIARSEAFGIVQIEAMAAGLPVVNTNLDSGVPFVSRHGETGFSVNPRDPAALASAINSLLADDSLRSSFGEAARRRAQQEFTVRTMTDRTIHLYNAVLAGVRIAPVTPYRTLAALAGKSS